MNRISEIYVRWIGIPVVALGLTIMLKHDEPFWIGFGHSLLFTAILWNGAYLIFDFYRKQFPAIRQTPRRLVLTLLTLYGFVLIADPLICVMIKGTTFSELLDPKVFFAYSGVSIFTTTLIGTLYETSFFFERWKESFKQNEELRNQQIRTQFEVLQNQMSPHFLFNSLNTLTTLISENQDLAIRYTEKLSELYRYILQNKERELVLVGEELEFVKTYVYLLKMRFPENLTVDFKVEQTYLSSNIAPLTLQVLVENAIKHNVVSRTHPLHVDVYIEKGKSIVVKNSLQVKNSLEKSTKTGLENIRKRYELLGNREIDVIITTRNFIVVVPLINVISERKLATG